jgi:hypothetical protein
VVVGHDDLLAELTEATSPRPDFVDPRTQYPPVERALDGGGH